jgi:hypothetical protein
MTTLENDTATWMVRGFEQAMWVYIKPILDGAVVINAVLAEVQKPPRLSLIE